MNKKYKISLITLVILFLLGLALSSVVDPNKIRCGGGLGCMDPDTFDIYYGDSVAVKIYDVVSIIEVILFILILINIVILVVNFFKQKKNKNNPIE